MTTLMLTCAIFAAAALYASVGHAGASGYLAAMAIAGVAPAVMKPTALVLNILVATITTWRFHRSGHLSWKRLLPFAATSIPLAFLGGFLTLKTHAYKAVVGCILLYAAFKLMLSATRATTAHVERSIPLPGALLSGAVIGLISGLTGTGGGIFLSPLLLFMGWAETRESSGMAAGFILVNSVAGLLGNVSSVGKLSPALLYFLPAAALGGALGAEYGSRKGAGPTLRRLLALVLAVAGTKLLLV